MKKKFLLISLLFVHSITHVFAQNKIFVASNGNDTNIGSIEKPLLTLAKALQNTQKFDNKNIDIILRKGIYNAESTVILNAKEIKNKAIQISAYENEEVVISGAKKVSLKWSKFNSTIYSSKLNLDFYPDAMFINGKTAIMARYPNYDSKARFFNGTAADAISPERVRKWENPSGGFFHALHAGEWGSFHYIITGKDNDDNLLMKGGWQNNRPSPLHNKIRFVENIFEELDAPGEWFYNKLEQTVYYYPLENENLEKAEIEFSRLKTILSLKGDELNPVKNISISNIKFTGTQRVLMEKHEPLLRSDWMLHRSGAITLEGTSNVSISNCEFSQLGGTAVMVTGYNRNASIKQSHFQEIGGSGICFVGDVSAVRSPAFKYEQFLDYQKIDKTPGPQNNLYPKNCVVYNNLIHDIGKIEKQATGIEIAMSESITVKNNTIYNTPRAGINIGDGCWGGHIVKYNDVFNTVLETGDHGAFNSWGRDRYWNAKRKYMDSITTMHPEIILLDAQKTTTISNNRFRCDHGWDIDLDDGSSNYHIYNNICLNGGIKLREGFFRTVENNILVNNSFHPHVWFAKSEDVFRRNIVTRNYYPIVLPNWGKEVDFNFFPDAVSLDKAKKNGTDNHSLYGNPMFIDANQGDYTLSKKSTAHQIGFKNIDTQNIGVLDAKLRSKALKVTIPKLELPNVSTDAKDIQTEWLDVILRNVNGLGDRSAYGLSSESGVVVIAINESNLIQSGLLTKDVIIGSDETIISDIFGLISLYQGISWKGKMNLNIMRDQQPKKIVIQLK
jgi:hypothetical protein